jgi:hypothetical protein
MNVSKELSSSQRINKLGQEVEHFQTVLQVTITQTDAALKNAYDQLGRLGEAINTQAAVINALVEHNGGEEAIKEIMDRQQRESATQLAEQQRATLQTAAAEGRVERIEAVDERSIIEGVEFDETGVAVHPGYWQFIFPKIVESLKKEMLDKKVGERVPTAKEGRVFEITGIWRLVPAPEPQAAGPNPEEPPAAPPVDNEHVAPGSEQFSEETVAAAGETTKDASAGDEA